MQLLLTASPDGRSLAFAVNITGYGRTLMVMSIDGGHSREILHSSNTQSVLPQGAMAWTSDSRYIVYSGRCEPGMDNGEQQLCAIPVAGERPNHLRSGCRPCAVGDARPVAHHVVDCS